MKGKQRITHRDHTSHKLRRLLHPALIIDKVVEAPISGSFKDDSRALSDCLEALQIFDIRGKISRHFYSLSYVQYLKQLYKEASFRRVTRGNV